jgi:hypothetical protein
MERKRFIPSLLTVSGAIGLGILWLYLQVDAKTSNNTHHPYEPVPTPTLPVEPEAETSPEPQPVEHSFGVDEAIPFGHFGMLKHPTNNDIFVRLYRDTTDKNQVHIRFGRRFTAGQATAQRFLITGPDGSTWVEGEFGGSERTGATVDSGEPVENWEVLKFEEDKFVPGTVENPNVYRIDSVGRVGAWDNESDETNDVVLSLFVRTWLDAAGKKHVEIYELVLPGSMVQ